MICERCKTKNRQIDSLVLMSGEVSGMYLDVKRKLNWAIFTVVCLTAIILTLVPFICVTK